MSKAIVIFSGGLDSTTCLAIAKRDHSEVIAISFDYGQRHIIELEKAKQIAKRLEVEHIIIKIPNQIFQGSALTDKDIEVPDFKDQNDIPITYVPARNTIFIAYALGIAESRQAKAIYLGVSAIDYSGYPDCRPEYISAYQALIDKAIAGTPIKLETPLIHLTKAATIKLGLELGVDYSATISCYNPSATGIPCEKCDSCTLRARGFAEIAENN